MISIDIDSFLTLKQQIQLLKLDGPTRRKVLRKSAAAVKKASKRNIKNQQDFLGRRFKDKKNGKAKMLKGLSRKMISYADTQKGVVTWKNPLTAKIATAHQHGIGETFTASKAKRRYGEPDYNSPATRRQAKALKLAGFKAKKENGKGRKNVSQAWIMQNLTLGQAGLILRVLRGPSKKVWQIPLPARAFLGVDNNEYSKIITGIFNDINQTIGAK